MRHLAFLLWPKGSQLDLDENDVAEILTELYGEEPLHTVRTQTLQHYKL